jgi:hypothetical protein
MFITLLFKVSRQGRWSFIRYRSDTTILLFADGPAYADTGDKTLFGFDGSWAEYSVVYHP